ncbi:MAG: CoA pyrophosphatase [Bacteroidales bacterium]|nr:CoA pyrophosphatase [Bacteroidales bacterium]
MNEDNFTGRLRNALRKPLPGTDVQWEMASSDRMITNFPRKKRSDSKLAAVLILLYPVNGKIHTLFIQRPVYRGVHSGQISFPGGKMEKDDRDLTDTAIREACEEVGLCSGDLDILGSLTPLYIPVSNIEVSPVVAYCKSQPSFIPDGQEVVSIIEASLADFFSDDIVKEKPMVIRNEALNVKYFDYKGHIIWGATAMILHELLVIILREELSAGLGLLSAKG